MVWLRVERVRQFSILCQFQFPFKFHVSRSGVRIPRFQVWGSNPSQDLFFAFFLFPSFLQRSINGEYFLNNFIDWLIWVVIPSHTTKNCLDWDSNPQVWKRGMWCGSGTGTPCCRGKQGKRFMIAYCFTQYSNECPLDSLLFPRQDNHVWRCTYGIDLGMACVLKLFLLQMWSIYLRWWLAYLERQDPLCVARQSPVPRTVNPANEMARLIPRLFQ